jgi:hypothetical protein
MKGLRFSFSDVLQECTALSDLAGEYIDPASAGVLKETRGILANVQTKALEKTVRWSIPIDRPLRSTPSVGSSARDGNGPYTLLAELSFLWEIRCITDGSRDRPAHFALDGIASTLVRILNAGAGRLPFEIARWKVEVGDDKSPGTHFHIQLNGESVNAPFPKDLDVPRLPAFAMTPFLVFETVLAELFQDEWERTALADNQHTRHWSNLQTSRLQAFVEWQRAELSKKATGTPWVRLKTAKPSPDMLIGVAR